MKIIAKINSEQSHYKEISWYLSGIVLLFICSQITIPLEPVPITLQTVGVMLIALTYTMKRGIIACLSYIFSGAIGVPVFAGFKSGITFGPTFGYLIGFVLCIYVMNLVKNRFTMDSFAKISLNCILGTICIFACGISWLSLTLGLKTAIAVGVIPFIIPGIIKVLVLAGIYRLIKN